MELRQTSSIYSDWSFEEDKEFERCLALDYFNIEDESIRWLAIAKRLNQLGWKRTPYEIEDHFKKLVRYVEMVENAEIEFPQYQDSPEDSHVALVTNEEPCNPRPMIKKGVQWSEDEHKLFLLGLKIYGRGDWRSISRNVVQSRSSTQVASHAQKYYFHSGKEKGKRSSIHHTTETDIDNDTMRDLIRKGLIRLDSMRDLNRKGLIPRDVLEILQPILDTSQQTEPEQCEQMSIAAPNEVVHDEQMRNYYGYHNQLTVPPEVFLDERLSNDYVSHNQLQMGALPVVEHNEQLRNDTISHSYRMSAPPEEEVHNEQLMNCIFYDQLQTAGPGVHYGEQVSNNNVSHNQLQSVTPPLEVLQYEQVGHLNQSQFQMSPADYHGQLSNNFL